MIATRVVILPDTHMPYHRQNAKTVKQVTTVLGRTLGATLSRFVSGIQNQITQRPENLRDLEIENLGGSVTRIEPCEESSAARDIGISPRSSAAPRISAAEEGTVPSDVHLEETEFLAEEMVTPHPQRTVDILRPLDVAQAVPLDQSDGNYSELPNRKTFSEMFPPEVTSRQKAAHEFFRLLQLQKEGKVKLHQDVFLEASKMFSKSQYYILPLIASGYPVDSTEIRELCARLKEKRMSLNKFFGPIQGFKKKHSTFF
ncbi:unnamed protein product [Allacma fusca]|uniref:Uncharacterized protein n=1 Tax=Allacma fusca TaxID=39272 RepID=A0A8J2P363_9HEXA|nr:unnamed protein product [Allacma fusca]